MERAVESYRARVEEAALAPYRAGLEELNASYLAALERALAEAQSGGDLEGALALRVERDAISEGGSPDADAADDLPPRLGILRRTYDQESTRLDTEKGARIAPLLQECLAALDVLVAEFTREGRLEDALAVRKKQEELKAESAEQLELAAVAEAGGGASQPGTAGQPGMAGQADRPSPEIPRDAVRHQRSRYKAFLVDEPITWEQARERCLELGGDLAWFDSPEDERFIAGLMRDVVAEKGHVPVWVGARQAEGGAWQWVNGEAVDAEFWQNASDAGAGTGQSVMVRWVGSFRASSADASRVAGYLCRWD